MPRTRQFAELAAVGGLNLGSVDLQMALLVGSPIINENLRYMSGVAAYEHDDASYSRVSLTGKQWIWNEIEHRLEFFHDPADFGLLVGEIPVVALYVINRGSDDNANDVIGWVQVQSVPLGDAPYVVRVRGSGAIWL